MKPFQSYEHTKKNVLFVCMDNARHSLMAESLLRGCRVPNVRAFSAGIDPADKADSFTLSALTMAGLSIEGLWPKHWDGFADPHHKLIDMVVIIGAKAAEALPRTFPGDPDYVVWMFEDDNALRYHRGVWRDMQLLQPRVNEMARDLGDGVPIELDVILAGAAE